MSHPRRTESRAAVAERRPLREWLARYGPAELVGTAGALLGAYLVHAATGSEIAAALDYQRFHRFLLAFPECALALLKLTVGRLTAQRGAARVQP